MAENSMKLDVDVCWVVGRWCEPSDDKLVWNWQLQGIARTEPDAIDMCRDADYFIGPVPVGVPLPHEQVEWPGCYYPNRSQNSVEAIVVTLGL